MTKSIEPAISVSILFLNIPLSTIIFPNSRFFFLHNTQGFLSIRYHDVNR